MLVCHCILIFFRSNFSESTLDDDQDNNIELFDVFDQLLQINYDQTMYCTLFFGVSNDFDTEPGKKYYNLLKNRLGNKFDNLFKKYLVNLLHSNRDKLSIVFEKLVFMSGCVLFYEHMYKLLNECIDDLNARNINDLQDKLAIIEGIHYTKLDNYRYKKTNLNLNKCKKFMIF